jgi:hypothetical protein
METSLEYGDIIKNQSFFVGVWHITCYLVVVYQKIKTYQPQQIARFVG